MLESFSNHFINTFVQKFATGYWPKLSHIPRVGHFRDESEFSGINLLTKILKI